MQPEAVVGGQAHQTAHRPTPAGTIPTRPAGLVDSELLELLLYLGKSPNADKKQLVKEMIQHLCLSPHN